MYSIRQLLLVTIPLVCVCFNFICRLSTPTQSYNLIKFVIICCCHLSNPNLIKFVIICCCIIPILIFYIYRRLKGNVEYLVGFYYFTGRTSVGVAQISIWRKSFFRSGRSNNLFLIPLSLIYKSLVRLHGWKTWFDYHMDFSHMPSCSSFTFGKSMGLLLRRIKFLDIIKEEDDPLCASHLISYCGQSYPFPRWFRPLPKVPSFPRPYFYPHWSLSKGLTKGDKPPCPKGKRLNEILILFSGIGEGNHPYLWHWIFSFYIEIESVK